MEDDELDEIWDNAPKFPTSNDRIDVDSFVQVYRDIDDLFEEDDEEDEVPKNEEATVEVEEEEEEEELKPAFQSISDKDGMVTKAAIREWDEVQNLLEEGLLGDDELEELWKKTATQTDQLDWQGFVKFNAELDDLFEFEDEDDDDEEEDDDDDEEEEEEEQGEEQEEGNEEDQVKEDVADATAEIEDAKEEKEEEEEEAAPPTTAETQQEEAEPVSSMAEEAEPVSSMAEEAETVSSMAEEAETVSSMAEEAEPVSSMAEEAPVQEEAELTDEEKELAEIYQEICNDGGLLAIDALKGWNEVVELLQDKLLNEAELQDLWTQTANVQQDSDTLMNQAGFLDFNAKLDDLFEFDEDEEEEEDDDVDEAKEKDVPTPPQQEQQAEQPAMVEGDDLPPGVIFASLVVNNDDLLVGKDDLQRWQELQEMLEEGDLLESELDEMFSANAKDGKLDEEGFVALYEAIDDLFEDDDDEEEIPTNSKVKQALLTVLSQLNRDEERLPCGLESTDQEEKQIVNIVALLEAEDTNQIKQSDGEIEQEDLNGTWELLFTSSAAMKFNKGLSGLGGSVPNGKFGGLKQMLIANK